MSILFIILAILALSFLIFIHELGHYVMARRVGMRVEVFAIGFGSPIYSWVSASGVKWQIGWLPFGGYVKIAGVEGEGEVDPYDIPDGFFGRGPFNRIKVAFMGPFVNFLFAFLLFVVIWAMGGREKSFHDLTSKVGWVDPGSELYQLGLRPGDEIVSYDGHPFTGAKDHLYAGIAGASEVVVQGNFVDYSTGKKSPFTKTVRPYRHPWSLDDSVKTIGVMDSARYLLYDKLSNEVNNPLPEGSPLKNSGIQYGDRVVWVDGEVIFSQPQLKQLLRNQKALLTVERGKQTLLVRVPRVPVQDLKADPEFREELSDWQFEAGLGQVKPRNLLAIPYNLTNDCIVENRLAFIDVDVEADIFPKNPQTEVDLPLEPGDRILAVDGTPIRHSYQMLALLQKHRVHIIVDRDPVAVELISWKGADRDFDAHIHWSNLQKIARSIGSYRPVKSEGTLQLLSPVIPKVRSAFVMTDEQKATFALKVMEEKKAIDSIQDSSQRARLLKLFEEEENQLLIGLPMIQDRQVTYNPRPLQLFNSIFQEIWRTLTALVTGSLSAKWVAGPVGIISVVHQSTQAGAAEVLFWIAAISLNLAVLNMLPIPILDGGTILFAIFEIITRKRLKIKTMERLIIPFAIILIAFFLYLTYNDISRLFG